MTDTDENEKTKHYCPEHEPCVDPKHNPVTKLTINIIVMLVGAVVWGLWIMLGVNMVLAGWLDAVPTIGYWPCVFGSLALRSLSYIVWERGLIR